MLVAKQVADLLTLSRALLVLLLLWLGFAQGADGLPTAVLLLVFSWTSDALDGPIARRSRIQYHSWLGDHDLEVDMAVAAGLLGYMIIAGYLNTMAGLLYAAGWIILILYLGLDRSPGMLFQAPIYGWFIWVNLREMPVFGVLLIAWIIAAVLLTWPRFPKQVIPGFLAGMRSIGRSKR